MPIFNKRKESTENPTAGCGSPTIDQVAEINRTLYDDDERITNHEALFAQGFVAGLTFVAIPKDAEVYGSEPRDYLDNAYSYVFEDYVEEMMNDALSEAAKNILDSLGIKGNVRVMTAEDFVNDGDA